MKIAVVHGQNHLGITYHVTQMLIEKSFDNPEVTEFFLPKDAANFCIGCNTCIMKDETKCPHRKDTEKIIDAMIAADVIVFDSPTYCGGASGQMKAFLDHLGYMWMAHRPELSMFKKIGIAVSTSAGKGDKDVVEFLDLQMMMLGIPKRFTFGATLGADIWDHVSEEKREDLNKDLDKLSKKIRTAKVKPDEKFKIVFKLMRANQKNNDWDLIDKDYWEKNGLLTGKNPWE